MKVETYEVENSNQSEAATMAQDSEASELIERLGLSGQRKLLNPQTETRNPYRVMTKQEQTVYEALLSQKTELSEYEDDCIPLRVLQVAAHAKECGLFGRLEVWHGDPAIFDKDPLLVGRTETSPYQYKYHMLARWGRELLSLEQLEAMAVSVLRKARVDQMRAVLQEAQAHLAVLEQSSSLTTLSSVPHFYK